MHFKNKTIAGSEALFEGLHRSFNDEIARAETKNKKPEKRDLEYFLKIKEIEL